MVKEGNKKFADVLPDAFVGLETWPGALVQNELALDDEIWGKREIVSAGVLGIIIQNGLWVLAQSATDAWHFDKMSLTNYLPWTTGLISKYISTPRAYMNENITAEVPGCPDNATEFPSSVAQGFDLLTSFGYVCRDSWWLTPACAALGDAWFDECAAVLDDDWGFPKPDVYDALSRMGGRIAKLNAGYDGMYDVVHSHKFNVSFIWWSTDTQYLSLSPQRVVLPPDMEARTLIPTKVAWSRAVKYSRKVETLVSQLTLTNSELKSMMTLVFRAQEAGEGPSELHAPGFMQKLACDWLRSHEELYQAWLPNPESCSNGEIYDPTKEACQPCAAGKFFQIGAAGDSCEKCQLGRSQPLMGQLQCSPCEPGTHGPTEGLLACASCGVGSFSQQHGLSACSSCDVGKARPQLWTSLRSVLMPDGSESWFPTEGASKDTACGCTEGAWLHGSECEPCLEGMTCPAGNNFSLKPGFHSSGEDPLNVFKCLKALDCPGGLPGTCRGGREGIACSICPAGKVWSGEICSTCAESFRWLILLLGMFVALIFLAAVHVASNWPMVKGDKVVMSAAFFVGMAITVVLTFGIYGTLTAIWVAPLSDFMSSLSFIEIDLEYVSFSCIVGTKSYISRYVTRMCGFPIAVVWAIAGVCLLHCVPRARGITNLNVAAFTNTSGFLMSALFVSVSLMSLEGLRCNSNPNGRFNLMADETIMCWEGGNHMVILVLSAIAVLLYPVFFITLTGIAVYWFGPLSIRHGVSFTTRVRFLTARMKPDCVIFSFWWNVRNFVISLCPVLASNSFGAQVFLMIVIFLSWMAMQTKHQCWRFSMLNIIDTIVSAVQVAMLSLFGFLGAGSVDPSMVGLCIIVMLLFVLLLLVGMAVHQIAERFLKVTSYDVFLTHHKAAAALLARHLKMLFAQIGSNINVFLDVDELDNLDNLSFAVKNTRKLIIVLTCDVLRRPWCAVEIGTAFLNKVPLGVIEINGDGIELTLAFRDDVIASFSQQDVAIFAQNGIRMFELAMAYEHVASLPKVQLPFAVPAEDMLLESLRVVAGPSVLSHARKPSPVPLNPQNVVYFLFNTRNASQTSVACMMRQLFRQQSWDARMLLAAGNDNKTTIPKFGTPAVAVVLMSKGLPEDPVGIGGAVAIRRAGLCAVTVLSQENFFKPPEEFFQQMAAEMLLTKDQRSVVEQLAPGATGQELIDSLLPLYKILAWHFAPEQNIRLLNQEFSIVERRAEKELLQTMAQLESGKKMSSPLAKIGERTDSGEDNACPEDPDGPLLVVTF
eukprot:TRINITY_DN10245_c0_g1_i1.p1 TRINITY_DN10245_c0_g1~~TRINITY_DN10245_c0_g1_i1.p1  ORF type:complete len:1436 (-),score=255.23 TRINITY_DN10245_c0_g1_i1:62-3883(-)